MAVVLHRHRVLYLPIPKVACSSLKTALFELDAGTERLDEMRARGRSIHRIYPSVANGGALPDYAADYFSFAVVRDPIDRFVSGYRTIVERTYGRSASDLRRLPGASGRPTIEEFVARFPMYYLLNRRVRHHFAPQMTYIGLGLGQLSHVYWLDELDRLRDDLRDFTGEDVRIPVLNDSGGAAAPITASTRDRIAEYLATDYAALAPLRQLDIPRGATEGRRYRRHLDRLYDSVPVRAARKLIT